jgi:DNA gyrase/topoisomerase IV subunit A
VTPAETTWVGLTTDGKIFRTINDTAPRTGGKEAPAFLMRVDTHQILYIVAKDGKCATLAVHVIPGVEKPEEGAHFYKISSLGENDIPIRILSIPVNISMDDKVLVSISKAGLIKKSALADLPGPSSQPFTLAKVNEGDELVDVLISDESTEYMVATSQGMAIRFDGSEVRAMGLVAAGVNAIKLPNEAQVIGLADLRNADELLFLASDGSGWRITKDDFPVQGRYGQGVVVGKLKPGNKLTGLIAGKKNQAVTVFLKKSAAKSLRIDSIPLGKRSSSAKIVLEVKTGDQTERMMTQRKNRLKKRNLTPRKKRLQKITNNKKCCKAFVHYCNRTLIKYRDDPMHALGSSHFQ